jgi:hypothetical protein
MEDYQFVKFEKSNAENKKYAAILKNKKTGRFKTVNFGDIRFEQFRDSTGLGLYSNLDHGDNKRRDNFLKRFAKSSKKKYSASWFAKNYLW